MVSAALYKILDESWQPRCISQDICYVLMMDNNGFLTIYGHRTSLLNNAGYLHYLFTMDDHIQAYCDNLLNGNGHFQSTTVDAKQKRKFKTNHMLCFVVIFQGSFRAYQNLVRETLSV